MLIQNEPSVIHRVKPVSYDHIGKKRALHLTKILRSFINERIGSGEIGDTLSTKNFQITNVGKTKIIETISILLFVRLIRFWFRSIWIESKLFGGRLKTKWKRSKSCFVAAPKNWGKLIGRRTSFISPVVLTFDCFYFCLSNVDSNEFLNQLVEVFLSRRFLKIRKFWDHSKSFV